MTGGGAPPAIACEVVRRGRFLVGEPFLDDGYPLAIGRLGGIAAEPGDLVLVEPTGGGRGRLLERLGTPRDVDAVLRALASEREVRRPFPDAVAAQAEALPADPGPCGPGRRDLSASLVFTIDPGTAKDHDDALEVVRDGDRLAIRVHIADVAAAVPAGSPIDVEAEERGTSVYLPGRVEPMLPHALSSGLCSLLPGRPRDVVTVEIPFDADLAPGRPSFGRSRVASGRRLAYEEVEAILEDGAPCPPDLRAALADVDRVTASLRRRRMERGALDLAQDEVQIDVGEGRVLGARRIAEPRAHRLVEELMILANEAVAEHLLRHRRPALYRVHEAPEPEAVEALYARLARLDVPTPPLPEHLPPRAAAAAAASAAGAAERFAAGRGIRGEAFRMLVLRTLQQARYDAECLGHSGLASPAYCHFTSPIRRYPDLVVHRALLASLGLEAHGPEGAGMAARGEDASARERHAEAVERRGDAICLAMLLRDRLRDDPLAVLEGEVVGLIGAGLFVRVADVFEGFLPSRTLGRERFEADDLGVALVGTRSGRAYRLGDALEVVVERIEVPRGRVSLRLAARPEDERPEPEAPRGRRRPERRR